MKIRTMMFFGLAVLTASTLSFVFGFTASMTIAKAHPELLLKSPLGEMNQINTVASFIKSNAVTELDGVAIENGAIKGMVATVDEHSEFLTGDEAEKFDDANSGKYVGIGIGIEKRDGGFFVKKVYPNSPAEKAGIKQGDRLISIDGKNAGNMDILELSGGIRGKEGTEVKLSYYRKGGEKIENVSMNRSKISYDIVTVKKMKEIPVFRIEDFSKGVTEKLIASLNENVTEKTKGIVIDLGGNPGGNLHEAVEIASLFLTGDQTILSIKGRNRKYDDIYVSGLDEQYRTELSKDMEDVLKKIPISIVIDKWSASASEVIAGALSDHKRAYTFGTKTYGKGTVQQLFRIGEKSYIKMTVAQYMTPNGRTVNKTGIEPDHFIEKRDDSIEAAVNHLINHKS